MYGMHLLARARLLPHTPTPTARQITVTCETVGTDAEFPTALIAAVNYRLLGYIKGHLKVTLGMRRILLQILCRAVYSRSLLLCLL